MFNKIDELITNLAPEACPLTSCELLQDGCLLPDPSGVLQVEGSMNNVVLKAVANKTEGYNYTVCL